MITHLTLAEIATATDGQLQGDNVVVTAVSTDTRKLGSGALFVALVGDNFNGHDFIDVAIAAGAVAVVVSEPQTLCAVPQVVVANTTVALGHIAHALRKHFTGTVVALTGSCGKTSVKELLAGILAQAGSVTATPGNFNNHIGVPLTLFAVDADTQFAVIEMGASGPHEIVYLSGIAEPHIALVNNVMAAHLEGFGSLQGVADAKGEIYHGLVKHGKAVINLDEQFCSQWLSSLRKDLGVVTFSLSNPAADVYASDCAMSVTGCARFTLHVPQGTARIELKISGQHQVSNALAAAACAVAAEATIQHIKVGLEQAQPVKGRMQPLSGPRHSTVIDDSYNANPGSVRSAIDSLMAFPANQDKWLVLGSLAEMGATGTEMLTELGHYARTSGLPHLLCVGDISKVACDSFGAGAISVADHAAAIMTLKNNIEDNSVVLIKGSRSARMEVVVDALTQSGGQV